MDFIAAFFAKFFHGHHVCPWDQFESTTIHFCEERVCAYVVQPANSYSCFAFVFAGLWLIARRRTRRDAAFIALGFASIIVGLHAVEPHFAGPYGLASFEHGVRLALFLAHGAI